MRHLVCRKDALTGGIRTSEYFPCVVEASSPEDALEQVFAPEQFKPRDSWTYLVLPMDFAVWLQTKPRKEFDIVRVKGAYLPVKGQTKFAKKAYGDCDITC